MSLCLLAGGVTTKIAATMFSVLWLHSVEHTEWREVWQIEGDGLRLIEAQIKGSGAGMEPEAGYYLENEFMKWAPKRPPLARLRLTLSDFTDDWVLCFAENCQPAKNYAPPLATILEISTCPD